jgi:phosphoribosylaminoimidazole-succinocarboxamide synthase
MVVRTLNMLPVECVVRGYLVGSGWAEYRESGTVCGIALPDGLSNGDRLPEPLFTPAFKAPMGEHDENISFEQTVDLVGGDTARELRDTSLAIFRRASDIAEAKGLILADSKFEFGRDRHTDVLTLGDEVLTSDSSRYWDAATYAAGGENRVDSFDKQIVRDWLAANWDRSGTPPQLPAGIVASTAERYGALISRLTSTD